MKVSKNNKRLYTTRDMSTVRHLQDVNNSRVKRGESQDGSSHHVTGCMCGAEGCFIVHRS